MYLPVNGKPLATKLRGPYKVLENKDTVNYLIETPNRRSKSTWCHVNMLRPSVTVDLMPTILTCHIEQSEIRNSDIEVIINNRTPDEVLLNDFNDFIETDRNSQKLVLNFLQFYQWNNNKT